MTAEEFLGWATRFPDALMLISSVGRIDAGNPAALRLLELKPGELAGKTLFDIARTSPESVRDALRLWSGSGQMLLGAAVFGCSPDVTLRCEGAVVRPREAERPALLILRFKPQAAAAERFLALNQKIDELIAEVRARKRSEEEIRQQREWLRVTLSSIGDAVIATDVSGHIEFLNGAAELLTGWKAAEAVGRPLTQVFDIMNEETLVRVENPVEQVLREGIVVGLANHTALRSKDGTIRPIEDSAAPIRNADHAIVGVVLVFHDVTQARGAEEALRKSERRFRLWVDLNVIAAGVADFADGFVEANDALLKLLGYTRDDLAEGRLRWLDVTPPEQRVLDERAVTEARQRGACLPYEKEYVAKDGRRIPVIIGFALFTPPVPYPRQKSSELAICFVVDISERKRAEDLLEKRVAERTAQLETALTDLEAFSYTVSHDLRAPLRTIHGFSNILVEDYAKNLDATAQDYLRKIIHAGEHLDMLIHDVLAYSKVSREEIASGPINLGSFLRELLNQYPNLSIPGVQIEIAPNVPDIVGNESLLAQCFSNLIGNAVKFVAPGTVLRVRIWSERRGHSVRTWIEDNGIGIAQKHLERIFGLFQRLHQRDGYEGTGIGLCIVRRAAERMGGAVGVESEVGRGSRFWIELPMAGL